MDLFQYLSSWFKMDEEEEEDVEITKSSKKDDYENEIQDFDLIKDRKKVNRFNQPNMSKVKKGRKSVRFTSNLTSRTKKRRPY